MTNTRTIIQEYLGSKRKIIDYPKYINSYLDGKTELTRRCAIWLEDYLCLPKDTLVIYEKEYQKWLNEVI